MSEPVAATMFKVDVFIPKARPFEQAQFERRLAKIIESDTKRKVYLASPEDIILAKLEWFRLGNEISNQQWQDVLGVLGAQGKSLDLAYLRHWASELGVFDLLEQALNEAGQLL